MAEKTSDAPNMGKGILERENLRPQRAANYAVKRAHGFKCAECGATESVLVVNGPDGLTTRCDRDIGDLKPTPGQYR